MEEKKQRQAQEKQEELFYAQQTMELNRMRYWTLSFSIPYIFRGMLQDDFSQNKTEMKRNIKNYNLNLVRHNVFSVDLPFDRLNNKET